MFSFRRSRRNAPAPVYLVRWLRHVERLAASWAMTGPMAYRRRSQPLRLSFIMSTVVNKELNPM